VEITAFFEDSTYSQWKTTVSNGSFEKIQQFLEDLFN